MQNITFTLSTEKLTITFLTSCTEICLLSDCQGAWTFLYSPYRLALLFKEETFHISFTAPNSQVRISCMRHYYVIGQYVFSFFFSVSFLINIITRNLWYKVLFPTADLQSHKFFFPVSFFNYIINNTRTLWYKVLFPVAFLQSHILFYCQYWIQVISTYNCAIQQNKHQSLCLAILCYISSSSSSSSSSFLVSQ